MSLTQEAVQKLITTEVLATMSPFLKDSSREGTHKLVDAIYDNPNCDVATQCSTLLDTIIGSGKRIEGYEAIFSPDEVRDNMLKVYKDYCKVLYSYHMDAEREVIKALHNKLFQDCIDGGILTTNDWEMIQ